MHIRATLAILSVLLLSVATAGHADAPKRGLRGSPESVAAARQLLEQAGGAETWRKRRFEVQERIYPASGRPADVRIVRDLARPARLLVAVSESGRRTEWLSPTGGWTQRNDALARLAPEALATEVQGLRQEPYAIYHRLANEDPGLRVELRDGMNLYVFDRDERLLCWFQRAPNGALLAWGNFYDGAINQHFYGPLVAVGPAKLPKFGVTSTGSYRFEYLAAQFSDEPLEEPVP